MDWEKAATTFGLPGLMIVAIYFIVTVLGKLWIASSERIQIERTKVEDKRVDVEARKADAVVAAMSSLSGKIDAHQITDIRSHQEMATGIARVESKLDALAEFTPVGGVQAPSSGHNAPAQGVPVGEYGFHRPKTGGGR